MKHNALIPSPGGLPRIYRILSVGCVSGWDIRRFRRILQFVTNRLEFAGLEKFHRMSCPLHLLRAVNEQQESDSQGGGANFESRVRGIEDQNSPFN